LAQSAQVIMTGVVTKEWTPWAPTLHIPNSDSAVAATMPMVSNSGRWQTVDVNSWRAAKAAHQQAKPPSIQVLVFLNSNFSAPLSPGDHVLLFLNQKTDQNHGPDAERYVVTCAYQGAFHKSTAEEGWARYMPDLPPSGTRHIDESQVIAVTPMLGTDVPPMLAVRPSSEPADLQESSTGG
jgi:hypothetical protein